MKTRYRFLFFVIKPRQGLLIFSLLLFFFLSFYLGGTSTIVVRKFYNLSEQLAPLDLNCFIALLYGSIIVKADFIILKVTT